MKKYLIPVLALVLVAGFAVHIHPAEARGRYGSIRIGGYTSSGKGSHYIGGYVRSCHGYSCY